MSKEMRTHNDDVDWEFERMIKSIQWRCIQVIEKPDEAYVDYHTIHKCQDLEEVYGEFLVDAIIGSAFPNGRWEVPEGVEINV